MDILMDFSAFNIVKNEISINRYEFIERHQHKWLNYLRSSTCFNNTDVVRSCGPPQFHDIIEIRKWHSVQII